MELIDLVSELLYKHNCVIIPDFGGFVGNFKSTDYDETRLLISPSRKKVVFNQSLTENDGLLINGLMAKKGISYSEAEKQVYLFSKFLKDRLEKYKNYEFKNVGSIYLNKEGKLIFVAYDGVNFHKKSYGLQDIKVKRLQKVIHEEVKPVVQKQIAVSANEEELVVSTVAKRRWFYFPQAAASIAILAVFGVMLWQILQTTERQNMAHQPLELEDSSMENHASLIPDMDILDDSALPEPVDTFVEAEEGLIETTIQYTDVTEEVIENTTPTTEELQTEAIYEEEVLTPIEPEVLETTDQKTHAARNLPVKLEEVVYYVAVAKNYTDKVESYKRRKLEKLEYELFEVELDGVRLLCIEKFISEQNAQDYLKLVRRYDDKYAFIYENQE
ncbi:MAG: hypothetical protein JJ975_12305 [Bacteroidia bacterium]|nr:hypothetical protein [Bacteroidia bacterium]